RPKYAPPAGSRPMFGPRPVEKSINFGPSLRRLLGHLRPERPIIVMVLVLAIAGILMNVVGPKILGRATDIIFSGVIGQQLPAGTGKDQLVARLRASGRESFASFIEGMDIVPGAGIDFAQLRQTLLLALSLYVAAAAFLWLQGYLLNGAVQRTIYAMRNAVE